MVCLFHGRCLIDLAQGRSDGVYAPSRTRSAECPSFRYRPIPSAKLIPKRSRRKRFQRNPREDFEYIAKTRSGRLSLTLRPLQVP
jgi:hypothetical protein